MGPTAKGIILNIGQSAIENSERVKCCNFGNSSGRIIAILMLTAVIALFLFIMTTHISDKEEGKNE